MKKIFQYLLCFMFALVLGAGSVSAMAFSSPTIGGPTGVITTPNAQIGWDGNDLALDAGFHYIKDDNDSVSKSAKINFSLFRCLELGFMTDMQKYDGGGNHDNDDYIIHAKFRFYPLQTAGSSSLAIGYKSMHMNYDDDAPYKFTNQQVYLVATYSGNFFTMPAETSLVFGKTWGKYYGDSHHYDDMIDFSMSFDLDLLPSVFKGYVHSISEFSNYSYSPDAIGADTDYRGAFNTGIRIALLKSMNRFKLNLDVLWLDVFDKNRCFGAGVAGGLAF